MTVSHRKTKVAAKPDDQTGACMRRIDASQTRSALTHNISPSFLSPSLPHSQLLSLVYNTIAMYARRTLP